MIAIVSNSPREASALAALVAGRPRPASTCISVAQFKIQLRKNPPALVVTRLSLSDGYSDDVIALLASSGCLPRTRVIVLAGADCSPRQEARQLSLGADCVLRDPMRPGVLVEYATKFLRLAPARQVQTQATDGFPLAGAMVLPAEQRLRRGNRSTHLAPKEIEFARLLAESAGKTLTYDFLYCELLNRNFSGETANLRVLLGKLSASFRRLGINLRVMVRVTPKSGYRYLPRSPNR